ncbi:MAG TPA: Asp-tRNA(Asn)/Glu-tRNA(Gln) amidotransferase subunit GatB [Clostridia bacterium]|nr:Asp-tRNA(Asn)/Glu-tRNA(Gln) amidotransferase subunit GatB [Clostridia bacterium]
MRYETVIGLEVHAELLTNTKIFCGCKNEFGGDANTHCCPVCLGLPGALPVLNGKVVEFAIKVGLATNCRVAEFSKMDRKNYFYPDLPKAFQISQYDLPLCSNGYIEIELKGETKKIRINRIHIEEDAGKLVHAENGGDYSLVDYNRAGVPLIEIVSEPDVRTPEEGRLYLEKLKSILEYLEVSDCKMQEGSLRCDANISLRPVGETKLGIKAEIKNMNSIKALQMALEYEQNRQAGLLDKGERVMQETRRWDDDKNISISMRNKELAHDYRYFPEPDLTPLVVDMDLIEKIRATIPELPHEKEKRFIKEYGLPAYDAMVITASKALAEFYEECLAEYNNPKPVSNWVMGELLRLLNDKKLDIEHVKFPPAYLAELLKLVEDSTISGTAAKQVFEAMFESGKEPKVLVKEMGLEQINDKDAIFGIVRQIIEENPKSVKDYKEGKDRAMGFLVGQTMKASKGKGNPQIISKIIKDIIDSI